MSETTPRVVENSSCFSASVDMCGCVLGGGAAACMLHWLACCIRERAGLYATSVGECQRGLQKRSPDALESDEEP